MAGTWQGHDWPNDHDSAWSHGRVMAGSWPGHDPTMWISKCIMIILDDALLYAILRSDEKILFTDRVTSVL